MKNPTKKFLRGCAIEEGRTLIVGSRVYPDTGKVDRRPRFKDALGVDMSAGEGVDWVLDLEEPLPEHFGTFAHVECMSVLEHSRRPWLLCSNLERAMRQGATIFVLVPWVWRVHGYPSDYWRMTPAAIESLFPSVKWEAQGYIVEDSLVDGVPKITQNGVRYFARSELVMFGRK